MLRRLNEREAAAARHPHGAPDAYSTCSEIEAVATALCRRVGRAPTERGGYNSFWREVPTKYADRFTDKLPGMPATSPPTLL